MTKKYKTKQQKTSVTIHDLPISERPRERFYLHGADKLSDAELIAIILRTGHKGESVISLAQRLLSKFTSLERLMNASIDDLKSIKGIGNAKAVELSAVFHLAHRMKLKHSEYLDKHLKKSIADNPSLAAELIRNTINDFSKEHFVIANFDTRGRLVATDLISVGTLNSSLVHPREVFSAAIKRHANYIIAAHNHPSGDLKPSEEDIKITKRLSESGRILGIELKDHLIISENSYFSFSEKGLI
jgi:DNA repair protein RadC